MRLTILLATLLALPAFAQSNYVRPHVRSDGTYVQGHMRSNPDSSRFNNYSTQGNYNPYTGQTGTRDPYAQPLPSYEMPAMPQMPQPYSTNNNGLYGR